MLGEASYHGAEGPIPLEGSGGMPPGNFERSKPLTCIFRDSEKRSDRFKTAIYLFISLVFEVKTAMPYLVADVKLVLL